MVFELKLRKGGDSAAGVMPEAAPSHFEVSEEAMHSYLDTLCKLAAKECWP